MLSISIDDRASPYLNAVAKNFPNELDSALNKLSHDAVNLNAVNIVATWTGRLRSSIKAEKIEQNHYQISANTPYARFVEGPTKPHYVSFYRNPIMLDWMTTHGMYPKPGQKGMRVYKSSYPAMGGGQYMFKTSLWLGRNLYSYIDRAIMKSLKK